MNRVPPIISLSAQHIESAQSCVQLTHPPMRQLEIERRLSAGPVSSAHWDAVATVSADATAYHDRAAPADAASLQYRVTSWSPYGRCAPRTERHSFALLPALGLSVRAALGVAKWRRGIWSSRRARSA